MSNEIRTLHLEGGPGGYTFAELPPPIHREDSIINSVTFAGLLSYVEARKAQILARKHESHVICNETTGTIMLTIGEHGSYTDTYGVVVPPAEVYAGAAFSGDFAKVKALFTTYRSPHDLFERIREVPHLFADAGEHATAMQALRGTTIKLRKMLADTSSDKGEREKSLKLAFEEQPPEVSWRFLAPIIAGTSPVEIAAHVLWEANSELNGVNVRVVNFSLQGIEAKAKMDAMKACAEGIIGILGPDEVPVMWKV